MRDPKTEKREREWADSIPEETERDDEPTYRDGSAVHECWAKDGENV